MKALLLLSGGFDSPIAGYLMKKKGLDIIALNFSQEPLTDGREVVKAKKLAEQIKIKKFISVKIGKQLAEIVNKCDHRLYYVLQRRLMLRIAEHIAEREGYEFLITGDNLAQVGSQTLSNMSVIDMATKLIVLRPLLTNDKMETIDIAREIGTFDTSCGPELCSLLGPKHPATSSTPNVIQREEAKIDVGSLVDEALATMQIS
ncbi:MAG: 7-cyano-7-deazaguanine synthase [Nanoarchaeota archaeon]|nr:7-cyano-7-deazaguanine synthase [Nanoarchaeota archaeon]